LVPVTLLANCPSNQVPNPHRQLGCRKWFFEKNYLVRRESVEVRYVLTRPPVHRIARNDQDGQVWIQLVDLRDALKVKIEKAAQEGRAFVSLMEFQR
jgi:hypothetical protein